jgi:SMODS-associating 2TM, beta-strand rich effector domain
MNRWHLLALVILVAFAHAAISLSAGQAFNADLFVKASYISGIVGAAVLVFDKWLWRFPPLHPWFVAAPDLNGSWDVGGKISFLRSGTSSNYAGIMTIEQTFFSIMITIDWGPEGRTRFLMKSPLATREEGFVAFSALYEYAPAQGSNYPIQNHRAGFFCHSTERRPDSIQLHYSTVGEQVGHLSLKRRVK